MTAAEKNDAGEMLLLEVAPSDIDLFNKLIDGYDNMALVTTLDARLGRIALWITEHARRDIMAIIKCLPIPVKIIGQDA